MPAAWSGVKDWVTGDVATESDLDTYVSQNLLYIYEHITGTGDMTFGNVTVTGSLTVDTNTLYVDNANNRVGILTLTPTTPLDVNGAATIRGATTITTGGLTVSLGGLTVSGGNVSITGGGTVTVANATTISGSLTVNNLATFASTTTFGGTLTVSVGGFAVTGNSTITGDLTLTGALIGTVGPLASLSVTTLTVTGAMTVAGNATFDTTSLFVNATTHRVGVGTAAPAYGLDVQTASRFGTNVTIDGGVLTISVGAVEISSSAIAYINLQQSSNNSTAVQFAYRKSRGTVAVPLTVVTADDLGDIAAQGWDGTQWVGSSTIRFDSTGTIGAGRVPGVIRFYTLPDQALPTLTERLTIREDGKIGMGVTAPTHALEILHTDGIVEIRRDSTIVGTMSSLYLGGKATDGSNHTYSSIVSSATNVGLATEAADLQLATSYAGVLTDSLIIMAPRWLFIANTAGAPLTDPVGGGYLYVDAGALKYRGSSGTVTPLAAA